MPDDAGNGDLVPNAGGVSPPAPGFRGGGDNSIPIGNQTLICYSPAFQPVRLARATRLVIGKPFINK